MDSKSEKWSKDQIELLIDAIKDEPCLYACDLAIYHNKHLRGEASGRVHQKVVRLRPTTTKEECQKKFKNLRNQFNIENAKVKASLKSGTGTDDIYKPHLWYFPLLSFLDTYVTPRKSRNSLEHQVQHVVSQSSSTVINVSDSQVVTNDDSNSSEQQQQFQLCSDGTNITLIPVLPCTVTVPMTNSQKDSSSSVERNTASPAISILPNCDTQQNNPTFVTPGPISPALSTSSHYDAQHNTNTFTYSGPSSPALSTSSTSGVSSGTPRRSKKRNRQDLAEEDISGALNNLAESLRQPIVMSNTQDTRQSSGDASVNSMLSFVGALLQCFQDEDLKLEIMGTIT